MILIGVGVASLIGETNIIFLYFQVTIMSWVSAIVKLGSNAFAPKNKCVLDNTCFKLYYKGTTSFLMMSVALLTGSLWVGKPISCMVSDPNMKEMFENHCLMAGTTTIYATSQNTQKEKYMYSNPYPGILPYAVLQEEGYEERTHPWYKWTGLMLFGIAGAFYVPRLLWKIAEGGRLNALRQDMGGKKLLSVEDRNNQRKLAVECFMQSRGRSNLFYCLTFFSLELLNIAIACCAMYLLNLVFQNQFLEFGLENVKLLLLKNEFARYDAMERIFPKVAQCGMRYFGPSGSVASTEGLCFLYHNYLNEFIFMFLWFGLFLVVCLTVLYLTVTRGPTLFRPTRTAVLHNKCSASKKVDIDIITKSLGYCDWFLLNNLLSEITPSISHAVLQDIAAEIRKTRDSEESV
jgi:hypothetical protein